MSLEATLREVIRLCDIGFDTYSSDYYDDIDEALAAVEQTDAVARMRSLCKVGHTLSSPRFAYPHIADAARSAIKAAS